ncbi:unnamed protein product [Rotaria sp. Silwood1]|nr:unnamed protein product [Rotaria sp. Silwood1]CAF5016317.1 unnamed protein product [Rotaria sp. Silwood1]
MSVSTIINIEKNLGRYGLSTLIVLGNVGNILTSLIFIRTLRKQPNSCTYYLLAASIVNWILINTTLISTLYGVDHVDPQHRSIVVCKLRWYGGQILLMLSRSFMIAACVDRWALTSSNARIRSICRPKIARNVILSLLLIWPIIPVHMAIFINNYSGHCGAPSNYALAFAIYLFIFIGFLPPFLMIFFGILALHNLKRIRSQVRPRQNPVAIRLHKADRDLMRMLAGEVLVYLVTTVLYPVNVLYGFITTPIAYQKSEMRLAIEALVGYIISPILNYIYCVAQFYGMMSC